MQKRKNVNIVTEKTELFSVKYESIMKLLMYHV